MLMKLILSCNQLCMFRSVANILDDQPERSYAETERDLNVSHMETSRRPPTAPPGGNAGGDPTQRTGGTIDGEMIRDVIEKV